MVLWGVFHGVFLVLERSRALGWVARLPLALGALYTTFVWTVSMALFRAESMSDATALLGRAFAPSVTAAGAFSGPSWAWPVLMGLALAHVATRAGRLIERWTALPAPVFGFTLGALVALALPWVSLRPAPYLYFAF
jgi:hypothetical protein